MIDKTKKPVYGIGAVAKSTARVKSRSTTRRASASFSYGAFFVPYESSGGLYAGTFGFAGVLVGRSLNRVRPAFFYLRGEKADISNVFTRRTYYE